MAKFYINSKGPDAWKGPLAGSGKLWEKGYGERALAACWEEAQGFPKSVSDVFMSSPFAVFHKIEFILGIPGHKAPLPNDGGPPSQVDLFVLARSNDKLVAITVDGIVFETFGELVSEWTMGPVYGKFARLEFLIDLLEINNKNISNIRDGLLHQAASTLLEARRFCATHALMLVHSFSEERQWFEDYAAFAALYGLKAVPDAIVEVAEISGIKLYFGWVTGEQEYLER